MPSLKRRLAAIVFTDIVGFTNLSSKDEEGAYNLVKKQREILKPIVSQYEGEWLKEEGDGLLLSFPSSKQIDFNMPFSSRVTEIQSFFIFPSYRII